MARALSTIMLPADHPMPQAVLFDMDGLLFDSEVLYRSLYFEMIRADGHDTDEAHFARLIGVGWKETIALLEADFPGIDCADFVVRWKRACHPDRGALPDLKHGVEGLLDLLDARGIATAIATGSERAVASAYLDHHGLDGRFAAVIASEDTARGKPHPDPFLAAAAALGHDPQHCLVLEDSPNGVRAAAAAGIPVVFVPDLVASTEEIERLSLAVANDLGEVAHWLASLRPRATRQS